MAKKKSAKKTRNWEETINRDFSESVVYLKNTKNLIYISIGIFSVFILFGYFVPAPEFLSEQIEKFIEQLIDKTTGMSWSEVTGFIFFNNIQSSFLGMILGVFFGIFPFVALVGNGYLLGFVAERVSSQEGLFFLWRIFPHGIFELPALIISMAFGLKIGAFIFQKKKLVYLREQIISSLKAFFLIIFPLLFVAALIEGTLIFFFA